MEQKYGDGIITRAEPLPNAFILGSAKCATSSMSSWLSQHKDIMVAKNKEPLFFSTNQYGNGSEWYSRNHFAHWRGERIRMDNTTMHLMIPFVPERIRQTCGNQDLKFIIMAREPIQRALAHWWMQFNYRPGYAAPNFNEAMKYNLSNFSYNKFSTEYERMRSFDGRYESYIPSYIEQGLYYHHLLKYDNLFGKESIRVAPMDYLYEQKQLAYSFVTDHLGVDHFEPRFKEKKIAKVKYPGNDELPYLYNAHKVIKKIVDTYLYEDVTRLSEYTGIDFIELWGYDKL